MYNLTVVIPAYNEEKNICSTLKDVQKTLSGRVSYEIIVVDDGSTDKTSYVLEQLEWGNLKIIRLETNQGKGAAVKEGALNSKGDLVLYMDADNSTRVKHFFDFLPYIESCDIVIGSRSLLESKITKKQPLGRIIIGDIGGLLIKKFLKMDYLDTQCGFKIFNKEATKRVFSKMDCKGWAFDFEILKIAEKERLKVKEAPVVWENSKDSRVTLLDYFKTLRDLFFVYSKYK